ncbi:MAG: hypothetical protein ACE5GL_03135 [Calditrichia bacterium]
MKKAKILRHYFFSEYRTLIFNGSEADSGRVFMLIIHPHQTFEGFGPLQVNG